MVQTIHANNLSVAAYLASGGDRIGVPVARSEALYAQFEHVYGVPDANGVTIDRALVLDRLIERLASLKADPLYAEKAKASARNLGPDGLDDMIQRAGGELRRAHTVPLAQYRAASIPSGIAVSLVA